MTPWSAFDEVMRTLSSDGRGEALFGEHPSLREAFEGALVGDAHPVSCLEFPLVGEVALDLFSFYFDVTKPTSDLFGYSDMYGWYSGTDGGGETCVGLTLELGESIKAGGYFQYRTRTDLIRPFFESVGLDPNGYLSVRERIPRGWDAQYVGAFPERGCVRLGGYVDYEESFRLVDDPYLIEQRLDEIGYHDHDKGMARLCAELMDGCKSVDFQFDVMPDGTLGDTFGLSLSVNECSVADVDDFFTTGYGAHVVRVLEREGLCDGRAWLLGEMGVGVQTDAFTLFAHPSHIKVKFIGCKPSPSKAYVAVATYPR